MTPRATEIQRERVEGSKGWKRAWESAMLCGRLQEDRQPDLRLIALALEGRSQISHFPAFLHTHIAGSGGTDGEGLHCVGSEHAKRMNEPQDCLSVISGKPRKKNGYTTRTHTTQPK